MLKFFLENIHNFATGLNMVNPVSKTKNRQTPGHGVPCPQNQEIMGREIEYKYLVTDASYRELATEAKEIRQGYLCRDAERVVRVRTKGEKGYLTVKGKTVGATRPEFEYEIPYDEAIAMLKLCEGNILIKTRFLVPFEGFTWEVDEFHGSREGLVTAEIELPDENTRYSRPPFVGESVTGNPAYYNSNL